MQFRSTVRHSAYAVAIGVPTPVVPAPLDTLDDVRHQHPTSSHAPKAPPLSPQRRLRNALVALYEWESEHQYLGRYSVDKLMRFDHYCSSTSTWRVAAVIGGTPVPVLALVLVFHALPLADPALGPAQNWGFFLWSATAHALVAFASILSLKQAMRLSHAVYTKRTMTKIASFVGVTNEAIWMIPAFFWRFPVPYRELLAGTTWVVLLLFGHWLFARHLVVAKWGRLRKYAPIAATQFALFFVFLGLAFPFTRLSANIQVIWVLAFPWFKIAMKKRLWQSTRRLDDVSTDVTVCFVEIYGALYQSVCMQMLQSVDVAVLRMAVDFVQAGVEVWMFAHYGFLVDGTSTVSTAVKIVESSLFPGSADEPQPAAPSRVPCRRTTWSTLELPQANAADALARTSSTITLQDSGHRRPSRRQSSPSVYVTKSPNSVFMLPADYVKQSSSRRRLLNLQRNSVVRARSSTPPRTSAASSCSELSTHFTGVHALAKKETSVQIDHLLVKRKDQARILEQSLQLLFASEVLIFVEFIQVVVPLIYTIIATLSWCLPNARYHTVLSTLSRQEVVTGLAYTVGYAVLELVTFGAMGVVMHRKFGVSTLYQLAFVLETYAMTIHGKFIGSFLILSNFALVHQGLAIGALTGRAKPPSRM